MTIASEWGAWTHRAGEIFEMLAGRPHSEIARQGVQYFGGRPYHSGS
jgi:hypothetical protein